MAKSAFNFNNYNFTFDKNEKKILSTFCKQAIKQMETDKKYAQEVAIFTSILQKLESNESEIKFTKNEKTRLGFQLRENTKQLKIRMDKANFFMRWFYKSIYIQYSNLVSNYFKD